MLKKAGFNPRRKAFNRNTLNTAKKRRRKGDTKKLGLDERVKREGGPCGYGIDSDDNVEIDSNANEEGVRRERVFCTPKQLSSSSRQKDEKDEKITNPYKTGFPTGSRSNKSPFTLSSSNGMSKTPRSSSTSTSSSVKKSKSRVTHILCSIAENLAHETCISRIDAANPTEISCSKQGNGQTYAETLTFLQQLKPDEVLLNEGRRNSQLVQKVLKLYAASDRQEKDEVSVDIQSQKPEQTVVKFVPRHYFDQTKGADLLRRICRSSVSGLNEDNGCTSTQAGASTAANHYDVSTIEDEYVILASSYAVLQYTQVSLGVSFSRDSLSLLVDYSGGSTSVSNAASASSNRRMVIDRSTVSHLELLSNAKTGKNADSLVGTIDCTKTSVGSRLLRSNLMSPPAKLVTIESRLDLVDTFLADEEFFYLILEHLEALPDIDKMMSHMALVPSNHLNNSAFSVSGGQNNQQIVSARMASKGISALVCIKTTLSVIPSFALLIEEHLLKIGERHDSQRLDESTTASNSHSHSNNATPRSEDIQNLNTQISKHDNSSEEKDETNTEVYSTTDTISNDDEELTNAVSSLETNFRNELLNAILLAMKQPPLAEILIAVTDIFTESTTFTRNSHAMRHQECFALKPNTDGMMDVLRKAFLANVDDIYRLADQYAEQFDITVSVKESSSRGYYLSLPADRFIGEGESSEFTLPPVFIQPVKNRRYIECTTEEIYSLNARAQENVSDLLLMTHSRIQEVIEMARDRYDSLASLSDAIALLDMCLSFADNVASSRLNWCRPVMSDMIPTANNQNTSSTISGSGALAIKGGRYPISVPNNKADFVANDTYTSSVQNFTLITGINGSGKSTYLKQIAIIVILAHCGSYVPAEEAFIPIRDRICTRIGNSDDLEHNISTFLLEMKETAFACNYATDKSLILIDELGRATSNEDGMAIAWSISEFLLVKRAITFFATHYSQLTKLANIYPNVQNQHLSANVKSEQECGGVVMQYFHKVLPGPCKMESDYGVDMAVICGWPLDVVSEARKLRIEVEEKLPDEAMCQHQLEDGCTEDSNNTGIIGPNMNLMKVQREAEKVLLELAKHLVALKESYNRLCSDAQRSYLQDLKDRMIPKENGNVIEQMRILCLNDEVAETINTSPQHSSNLDSSRGISSPRNETAVQVLASYDIETNSRREVCNKDRSKEKISQAVNESDSISILMPQILEEERTNDHDLQELKQIDLMQAVTCNDLEQRNGSSYDIKSDESQSLNSEDKKMSPVTNVVIKNEIIDTEQQQQPELIVIDDQTSSSESEINSVNDDFSTTSHSSSSSNSSSGESTDRDSSSCSDSNSASTSSNINSSSSESTSSGGSSSNSNSIC